jgi:uncharacterized protein YkwD
MATVNEYRVKLGLGKLTQSSQLEANALKTAKDGNGELVHQMLPGTFAQVLAAGGPELGPPGDNFYNVFVGGWLCEKPDLPGLNGECATASDGWFHDGTSHVDVLTSDEYKSIGCANDGGVWACDLGH